MVSTIGNRQRRSHYVRHCPTSNNSVTLKTLRGTPSRCDVRRTKYQRKLGTPTMKRIPHLTLGFVFAFSLLAAVWLWTSASAKVTRQTTRSFAPPDRSEYAAVLAPLDNLFQTPWRGFDTGIFGSGFGPNSFAVGDLDGDGDLDILV